MVTMLAPKRPFRLPRRRHTRRAGSTTSYEATVHPNLADRLSLGLPSLPFPAPKTAGKNALPHVPTVLKHPFGPHPLLTTWTRCHTQRGCGRIGSMWLCRRTRSEAVGCGTHTRLSRHGASSHPLEPHNSRTGTAIWQKRGVLSGKGRSLARVHVPPPSHIWRANNTPHPCGRPRRKP